VGGKKNSTARPAPSSPAVSAQMSRLGRRDTAPELALRSELHRRGLRFRVDRAPVPGLRSRADLVFGPARVAVYVDGCFWHRCPQHRTEPKSNAEWWDRKLTRNQERDAETNRRLAEHDWAVVRIWEHEDPIEAADQVEGVVRARR
jgi:DNA mismatch endonuclease (patch repair protein)